VNYLLDTNTCIALMKGTPSAVRLKLQEVRDAGSQVFVSAAVVFELWYGASKNTQQQANSKRVETFLAGPVSVLPFDEDDARATGTVRAEVEAAGKPIGAYDLLIAGQALRRELTLVTAQAREFARIKDLLWEDWAKR
jgi:tRNA(fMet)-specific endonuclease VapC